MATSLAPPTAFSPDKKFSDRERWICIYPAYINSKKSRQEGRRIPKEVSVENPSYQEMRDVLSASSLRIGVENKVYSREKSKELSHRGRIRVQLKNDDGSLCNPDFPTRDSLFLHLGKMIPLLKSRQGGRGSDSSSQQHQSQSTGGNKKGKGKRR